MSMPAGSTSPSPFDIIGAGVAGLTTAIALAQHDVPSRVFEQTNQLAPVGAGIVLGINAMQVFERLGLREQLEAAGNHVTAMTITDQHLTPLSVTRLDAFEARYGARTVAIHRGVLQSVLRDQLSPGQLHLGHALVRLEPGTTRNRLVFADGTDIESRTTIGADGIHSIVRRDLFPDSTLRRAHQECWRGIADYSLPRRHRSELVEAWGDRGRFGFVPLSEQRVYWYALRSQTENAGGQLTVADLQVMFESFDPLVGEILGATDAAGLITTDIQDLRPLRRWHQERTCLIGDAAHATTPNLGQGAAQAIEDADVLAAFAGRYEPARAFAEFETVRRRKAQRVVSDSWQLGKIAHQTNPVIRSLRNRVMRATPQSLTQRRMHRLFQLASTSPSGPT